MSLKSTFTRIRKWVVATLAAAAAAVAAFFGYEANSQTGPVVDTLTWTAPTQYTDNTPIPAGTITGYKIAWGAAPGGPYPGETTVGAVLTTQLTRAETFGTRCYRAAALIGQVGGEWSAERCKTVQAPPKAPGNLNVQ